MEISNFVYVKVNSMKVQRVKTTGISLLIFLACFIEAACTSKSDLLKISYDHLYAVKWKVSVYSVAEMFAFSEDNIQRIFDTLSSIDEDLLVDGEYLLCYYTDKSITEAQNIKSKIEKVKLPNGYKWGFGLQEYENQQLWLIVAICDLNAPFNMSVGQSFFEKDSLGNPALGFSLMQGESEKPFEEYQKYVSEHKHIVIEINDCLFAPTQMNQIEVPDNRYVTISNVPYCILEHLYKPINNAIPITE